MEVSSSGEYVDKKEVLQTLRNKSKREAEKIVREFSNIPEKKRSLKLSLNQIQEEKWHAVKAKLAHCNLKEKEILEKLCDLFLTPKPSPKTRAIKPLISETAQKTVPLRSTTSTRKHSAAPTTPATSDCFVNLAANEQSFISLESKRWSNL